MSRGRSPGRVRRGALRARPRPLLRAPAPARPTWRSLAPRAPDQRSPPRLPLEHPRGPEGSPRRRPLPPADHTTPAAGSGRRCPRSPCGAGGRLRRLFPAPEPPLPRSAGHGPSDPQEEREVCGTPRTPQGPREARPGGAAAGPQCAGNGARAKAPNGFTVGEGESHKTNDWSLETPSPSPRAKHKGGPRASRAARCRALRVLGRRSGEGTAAGVRSRRPGPAPGPAERSAPPSMAAVTRSALNSKPKRRWRQAASRSEGARAQQARGPSEGAGRGPSPTPALAAVAQAPGCWDRVAGRPAPGRPAGAVPS